MDETAETPKGRLEWRDNSWWVVLPAAEMTIADFIALSGRLIFEYVPREKKLLARQKGRRSERQQKARNAVIAREQLVEEFAERFVRNRHLEGGTNMAMVRGAAYNQVWSYMRQWLADHRELPTGEHIIPGDMYFGAASDPQPLATKDARRVDFTKLANDPDYPKLGRDDTYVAPEDSPPLYKRKRG